MPDGTPQELAALTRRLVTMQDGAKESLARIVAELDFANQLRALHPDRSDEWARLIEAALRTVRKALEGGASDGLAKVVDEAEHALAPIGAIAKTYTMFCVGHAHIDMNWMWSWPETVSITNDTFSTVDRLMDAYPDFCFTQSQTSVYELTRTHNPELFERIRKRVKEGRWEVAASMWVEGDKNLAGGEALCRHLLYTRRFMEQHFGLAPEDVLIDWEPDTFGHAHTIPSFLARAGVRRYYHCRTGQESRPPVFWWQGPDGARVLVYKEIGSSWYNSRITPDAVNSMMRFCRETGLRAWMNVYGVGDHGGGPTQQDLERGQRMNSWPIYPNIVTSTTKPFYELLEQNGDRWPVLDKELNYEFTGCYTSQSNIKRANRFGEQLLYRAEAAAALAWRRIERPYPTDRLREAWVNVLFNQFHDILPGSGVKETYEYAQGLFQRTAAQAGAIATESLRALAAEVNTNAVAGQSERTGRPGTGVGAGAGYGSSQGGVSTLDAGAHDVRLFVVFNLTGWDRSTVATAMLWDVAWDRNAIVVTDDAGETVSAQVITAGDYWGHRYITVAFPAKDVPAMGYRTYALREGSAEPSPTRVASPGRGIAENDLVRVEVDWATGGIAHLVDKRSGLDLADPTHPMGMLEYLVERHHGMTAWTIGDIKSSRMLTELVSLQQSGGLYQNTITGRYKVDNSEITVNLTVRAGDPCVEVTVNALWLERGTAETGVPMLRVHVPTALERCVGRYEIPYGTITRTLSGGEEVPSQRWAEVAGTHGGRPAGVLLLNDSKYGYSLDGNDLRLTLIRSSYDPDVLPELGNHAIRLGIVAYGEEWKAADSIRVGAQFNQPLVVVGADVHDGPLAASGSFLAIETPNVVLAALKKAEDSEAIILRLYETLGVDTDARVAIDRALAGGRASLVDLLERPVEGRATSSGDALTVHLPPHGIVSVKLER